MAPFDYSTVKVEDLELHREPRKSQFTIVHKPSGAVAQEPVVPDTFSPARFRRPTQLPKENRTKGMVGYIEGADSESKSLFVILEGDGAKNEYIEALVASPDTLKACFEGAPKTDKPAKTEAPEASAAPATPAAAEVDPSEVPTAAPTSPIADTPGEDASESLAAVAVAADSEAGQAEPAEVVDVPDSSMSELDELLSGLDN